ncbi:MAG: MFS transporter [Anaerolineales bacterium]|nr:MFS transporter [Anaerolineales bacterium]
MRPVLNPDREPPTRLPWMQVAALTSFAVAIGITINTLDPPLLGHRLLDLAPANKNVALGLITLGGLLAAMIWQPVVGALSDRTRTAWGRRLPYLVAGTPIVVIGLLSVVAVPSLGLLLAAVVVTQLGINTVQGPWQALIPDRLPAHQRGRAAGLKSAFEILGFVIGRQLAGQLVAAGQPLLAAAVAGVSMCIALAITARLAAERAAATSVPPVAAGRARQLLPELRRHPAFAPWFANRLLIWGGFITLNTFLLFYVIDVLGMPQDQAQRYIANLATIIGLMLLLVPLPAGWLADRFGRRPLLVSAGLLASGGTALILVARDPGVLLLAAGVLGLGVGVFLSASWALVTDIVPRADAARYLGVANIATAAGSAVARLIGAALIDPLNRLFGTADGGYLVVYSLALAAFAFGTVIALGIPSPPLPADDSPHPPAA